MKIDTERVTFRGASGDQLAARIERPEGEVAACALFAHCFTCGKDLKATRRLSHALAARGFAVMRFDFTGLGESEGDFADTDFSSNLEDLVAAAEFLGKRHGGPELLIGHSLGGAAVLKAAARIPASKAVATLGAPSDTGHLSETLLERAPELAETGEAKINLGGRSFKIRRRLLEDLESHAMSDAIAGLGRPLLIFHSPVDRIVGIDHARRIYEAARHPKSFVSLDGADHLLLDRPEDAVFTGEVLAAWAARYVGGLAADEGQAAGAAAEKPSPASGDRPPHGKVHAAGGVSGYRVEIRSARHDLTADEPESVGGTDTGPNPYELLLAALAACKVMTLRMYADRKGWPLAGSAVTLEHSRIHAKDCEDCATQEGKIDRIDAELELEGELDADQRARLLEIADRCPVHRTLTTETSIVSRLA